MIIMYSYIVLYCMVAEMRRGRCVLADKVRVELDIRISQDNFSADDLYNKDLRLYTTHTTFLLVIVWRYDSCVQYVILLHSFLN